MANTGEPEFLIEGRGATKIENFCDVILVTFFGDNGDYVAKMTS